MDTLRNKSLVIGLGALASFVLSFNCFADTSSAYSDLIQARNKGYSSSVSGKDTSSSFLVAATARSDFQNACQESFKQSLEELRQHALDRQNGREFADPNSSSTSRRGSSSSRQESSSEESNSVHLDGNSVPKEIVFPGSQPNSPRKPAALQPTSQNGGLSAAPTLYNELKQKLTNLNCNMSAEKCLRACRNSNAVDQCISSCASESETCLTSPH